MKRLQALDLTCIMYICSGIKDSKYTLNIHMCSLNVGFLLLQKYAFHIDILLEAKIWQNSSIKART